MNVDNRVGIYCGGSQGEQRESSGGKFGTTVNRTVKNKIKPTGLPTDICSLFFLSPLFNAYICCTLLAVSFMCVLILIYFEVHFFFL